MRAVERPAIGSKVVVGVILGAIALACVFAGKATLFVLVLALALVAAGELFRLARVQNARPVPLVGFAAVAASFVVAYGRHLRGPETLPAIIAGALVLSSVAVLVRRNRDGAVLAIATTVFVAVYVGTLGSYIVVIRGMTDGFRVVLVFGLMVVLNDAGAWAVGRTLGRHRLAKTVSPEKSWEGFFGGALLTFIVGLSAGAGLQPPMTISRGLVLAALVSIAAPLGDLFESMIKRDFQVKDAGDVIPSHGGALDRLDSLLFTAPLFFYAFRALTS